MQRFKVKPLTLLLPALVLVFFILGPNLLSLSFRGSDPIAPLLPEKPAFTGIIELWDIPYVSAGTGSHALWLNRYIRTFEKKYPGVYIKVRTMPPERLAMYLMEGTGQDFLPDIIALDPYSQMLEDSKLIDLNDYFHASELAELRSVALDRVYSEERLIGVPFMMGVYGLYINNGLVKYVPQEGNSAEAEIPIPDFETLDRWATDATFEKKSGRQITHYYGFCTYSTPFSQPLLSMIYSEHGKIIDDPLAQLLVKWKNQGEILPEGFLSNTYSEAFRIFAQEKRVGILLGNTQVLYGMERLKDSGKGFEYSILPIPMFEKSGLFTDQIAAYGLIKSLEPEREAICVAFLKGMLETEPQQALREIGMFSVLNAQNRLYEEGEPMSILEASLPVQVFGPSVHRRARLDSVLIDFSK